MRAREDESNNKIAKLKFEVIFYSSSNLILVESICQREKITWGETQRKQGNTIEQNSRPTQSVKDRPRQRPHHCKNSNLLNCIEKT